MPESPVDIFQRLLKHALAHKPVLQGKGFRAEIDGDGHLRLTGLRAGDVATMATIIIPGNQVTDLAKWMREIYERHAALHSGL